MHACMSSCAHHTTCMPAFHAYYSITYICSYGMVLVRSLKLKHPRPPASEISTYRSAPEWVHIIKYMNQLFFTHVNHIFSVSCLSEKGISSGY